MPAAPFTHSNHLTIDTALPWVLSNTQGSRNNWHTHTHSQIPGFIGRLVSVGITVSVCLLISAVDFFFEEHSSVNILFYCMWQLCHALWSIQFINWIGNCVYTFLVPTLWLQHCIIKKKHYNSWYYLSSHWLYLIVFYLFNECGKCKFCPDNDMTM